jgi:hypothetical protein
MTTHAAIQGTCLCGAVRYEVGGPLTLMINCHCSMCRKHHGSAYATFAAAPLMKFRWLAGESNISSYQSSDKGVRSFCRTCGSVTPTLVKEMDLALVPAGNLQGDLELRPQSHVFVGSKAPWYSIRDALPQHEEYPPEMGMGGVERDIREVPEGVVGGSCLCGRVAYEAKGAALRMVNCYCSRCRRGRSAAHATNLFFPLDAFRFTRGEHDVVDYRVPDARFFGVAFCGHCGAAAPRISRERGGVVVPAGTLDCDPGMRAMAHIHVASKANWVDIKDDLPQFPENPPS